LPCFHIRPIKPSRLAGGLTRLTLREISS